ncbi:hypothetical protein [Rhodococcus sovatensis]|uniref:DUF1844 domain-containing protein n=1 Tax=Rhodococcus sovatensis TaxID=1805840 RepID=A0ABZ2PZA4_9NOCA
MESTPVGTVPADAIDPDQLDFMSFVEFAVDKASTELEQVDPVAMRLVLELHRVTCTTGDDREATDSALSRLRGLLIHARS